jgi:hypothetical protein
MAGKITWSRDFEQQWKNNPQQTAQKYGLDWSEIQREWQNQDWKNTSSDEFKDMWRKSKWAGWFNW